MVQFLPLDVTDEDSMQLVLSHIDNAIQYGEAEVSGSSSGANDLLIPSRLRNQKSPRIWIRATLRRNRLAPEVLFWS